MAPPLGLANVIGVFIVTIGGLAMATLIAACEFLYGTKKQAEEMGTSWLEEIKEEFLFAVLCQGDTKEVKRPSSETSSLSHIDKDSQDIEKDDDAYKKSTDVGPSPSILKRTKRRASGSSTTAPEGSSLNHYPENVHGSLGSIENQYPRSIRSQFGYGRGSGTRKEEHQYSPLTNPFEVEDN